MSAGEYAERDCLRGAGGRWCRSSVMNSTIHCKREARPGQLLSWPMAAKGLAITGKFPFYFRLLHFSGWTAPTNPLLSALFPVLDTVIVRLLPGQHLFRMPRRTARKRRQLAQAVLRLKRPSCNRQRKGKGNTKQMREDASAGPACEIVDLWKSKQKCRATIKRTKKAENKRNNTIIIGAHQANGHPAE